MAAPGSPPATSSLGPQQERWDHTETTIIIVQVTTMSKPLTIASAVLGVSLLITIIVAAIGFVHLFFYGFYFILFQLGQVM